MLPGGAGVGALEKSGLMDVVRDRAGREEGRSVILRGSVPVLDMLEVVEHAEHRGVLVPLFGAVGGLSKKL